MEKMGDGAFSNVYKAIERKTGRKCAVKVVRKYELNHSQVRIHPAFNLPNHSTTTVVCIYTPFPPLLYRCSTPWPGWGIKR